MDGVERLINNNNLRFSQNLPSAFNNAALVDLSQVITSDSYASCQNVSQPNEQVSVVFKKNGNVVAQTAFAPDLEDLVQTGVDVSSLGAISLPDGADEVVIMTMMAFVPINIVTIMMRM